MRASSWVSGLGEVGLGKKLSNDLQTVRHPIHGCAGGIIHPHFSKINTLPETGKIHRQSLSTLYARSLKYANRRPIAIRHPNIDRYRRGGCNVEAKKLPVPGFGETVKS